MIKIAITPEALTDSRKEAAAVRILLESGWDRVHLRHPSASLAEMRRLIEEIPQKFHKYLVLHGHFELSNHFNLGGLHLNNRCTAAPALYRGQLSRSCHSIDEILRATGMAYVTLSPIFDSISKQGYRSNFTQEQLKAIRQLSTPVIALGGVTAGHIPALRDLGFSGFAMLGSIPWDGSIEELRLFSDKIANI